MNSCFEYRFTIKDLMLPEELPKITDMYIDEITVKLQDLFTQVTSHDAIKDGVIYTYDPYSAVICQDGNGLEFVENYVKVGEEVRKMKFIPSGRVIQREDNSLFVVSSNLKIEKHINIGSASSSYKLLILLNNYDAQGNFVGKTLKSSDRITVQQLRECFNPPTKEERKGREVCTDVILCDILIFMLKSCNLSGKTLEELKPNDLTNANVKKTLPVGWLTPEEKLRRYGKKGIFMDTFVANRKSGDGSQESPYDQVPNDLFVHIDMQGVCDKLFSIARPSKSVFVDENKIVAPFRAQYAIGNELISVSIKSDN